MTLLSDIRELSLEELQSYLKKISAPRFHAAQIFQWIYQKGSWSFDVMSSLPQALRQRLGQDFHLAAFKIIRKQASCDGTTKFLFELRDHEKIESVLIPMRSRTTACISSQAGCKFGCKFCASGIGGWKRNLSCAEIVVQVLHLKEEALKHKRPLTNIVFMGTGENFDNYDHVMKAIRIINADQGINMGARHITISTVGVVPKIKELAQEGLQVELAISLHGYDNPSRDVLMPVNKKYPFDALMAACREYVKLTRRQITFEYILIKDVTCTGNAVYGLKEAFKGMRAKMNLIPYNPVPEFGHETPSREEVVKFKNSLEVSGIHATIRASRGKDVNAACGQLRHAHEK